MSVHVAAHGGFEVSHDLRRCVAATVAAGWVARANTANNLRPAIGIGHCGRRSGENGHYSRRNTGDGSGEIALPAVVVVLIGIETGINHLHHIAYKGSGKCYLHRLVRANANLQIGYVLVYVDGDNTAIVVRVDHDVAGRVAYLCMQ